MIMDEYVVNKDLPEESYLYFYQYAVDRAYATAHSYVIYYGFDYETAFGILGYDEDLFLAQAKYMACSYLLCAQIMRDQNLTWSDEDYQAQVDSFVASLMESDKTLSKEDATAHVLNNLIDYVHAELICATALEWLAENCY